MPNKYESLGFLVGFLVVFIPFAFFVLRKKIRARRGFESKKNMDMPSTGNSAQTGEQPQVPLSGQPQASNSQTSPLQVVDAPANTSGHGSASIVPPEIKGWNWGAFLLNWIWGIGNQTYLALLCFVPLVNIVMIFVLGAKGNEWAWRNKTWISVDEFKRVQKKWAIAGIIFIGAAVLLSIGTFVFILLTISQIASTVMNEQPTSTVTQNSGVPTSSIQTLQATSTFDFLGNHFVLADNLSNGQEDFYEFIPEGQNIDTWQNLVTLVRDTTSKGAATHADVDAVAEATLQQLKGKGAFVYNSFSATSTVDGPVDVMTLVFTTGGIAEIDLKKLFLTHDGFVESATYGVQVTGRTSAELTKNVNVILGQTDTIGPQVIDFKFPEPWNSGN